MDRWVGKVAIVTGASSGIGASIAEKLVEAGLQVVALARRKERLEELAKKLSGKKGKLHPIKTDIAKEEDILHVFEWIKKNNLGPVHILINNAAVSKATYLTEQTTEEMKETLQINVIGLCVATREAVKDMKENKVNGHIIHINSVLGHQLLSLPKLNVYPATKYAVTALAETLRMELNHLGLRIKITSVSPGLVDTELIPDGIRETETMQKVFQENKYLRPEDIANGVLYVLSTPPHVQVQELTIRPTFDTIV